MTDSNSEDDPSDPGGDQKQYFENREDLESLFGGGKELTGNLREAEKALHVVFVLRGDVLKVLSSDTSERARAEKFLGELKKFRSDCGRALTDQEFRQILSAFSESRENELQNYFSERVKVSPRKREIVPRTPNQLAYLRAIRQRDIVFGVGPAGTGKTYLAMAMGVSMLLEGNYDRIILTRPAVEAGENLGFLPGKLEEKINPYLRPLYDALYDMLEIPEAEELIERNIIEVAPLAFMRGRTLNNAFIILDEAQNTRNEQMLMFLTRLGFHSRCVICGDPTQTDLPGKTVSGLTLALRKLRNIEEIAICPFTSRDVVRHSLVEKIVNAYQSSSGEEETCKGEQQRVRARKV